MLSGKDTEPRREPVSAVGGDTSHKGGTPSNARAPIQRSASALTPGTNARERPSISTSRDSFDSLHRVVSASAVQSAEHGADLEGRVRLPLTPIDPPQQQWRTRWQTLWFDYKGVVLMILAQMFASMMSTTARFLETLQEEGAAMNPFQVLFVRMSITALASFAYMWWAKVPDAPLGPRGVRVLLLARGFGGFFGVFGLYYSLIYLPLGEATVITFIAPLLAAWICSILLKTPFTRVHKIAAVISLCGVGLIAQPFKFIDSVDLSLAASSDGDTSSPEPEGPTPVQHAIAVLVGLVGVCGAACAYTTISWIGKRAHPLISVNYFATWCTIVSVFALAFLPDTEIVFPRSSREWLLMAFLGTSGFVMQYLLTASLSHEHNRSITLNMVYMQMLFALGMDRLVWGTVPGWISIGGSTMILGSAIWVTIANERDKRREKQSEAVADEEEGLVQGDEGYEEPEEEIEEDGHRTRREGP